jgi:hypothetical protein
MLELRFTFSCVSLNISILLSRPPASIHLMTRAVAVVFRDFYPGGFGGPREASPASSRA